MTSPTPLNDADDDDDEKWTDVDLQPTVVSTLAPLEMAGPGEELENDEREKQVLLGMTTRLYVLGVLLVSILLMLCVNVVLIVVKLDNSDDIVINYGPREYSPSIDESPSYDDPDSFDPEFGAPDYPLNQCFEPHYERVPSPASCQDLTIDHTNFYWGNEKFDCRLNERPCDSRSSLFRMDLGPEEDGDSFDVDRIGGSAEVWFITGPEDQSLPLCFRFRAEGHWYYDGKNFPKDQVAIPVDVGPMEDYYEQIYYGVDVNDYEFSSLECCDPEDDYGRVYIIVDGVLVDSCPNHIAENCRHECS